MPVDWVAVEDALHAWLTTSTGLPVHWEDQNDAPQPQVDYGTLSRSGPRGVGTMDWEERNTNLSRPPGQEVQTTVKGLREITITAQVVTRATTGNAWADPLLGRARTELGLPGVRERLRAAGVGVIEAGEVRNLTGLVGVARLGRASMALRVYVVDSALDSTGYIETVDFTTTLTP